MSHGGDGFRGAELAAQASVLRAEIRLASQQVRLSDEVPWPQLTVGGQGSPNIKFLD